MAPSIENRSSIATFTLADQLYLHSLGDHITDFGADGYGPLKVRSLRRSDVSKARINADSYRWYAQVRSEPQNMIALVSL